MAIAGSASSTPTILNSLKLGDVSGFSLVTGTSVASFLVLGGGGGARPPNVPTEKSNLYARASASETYIFRSPNTSARTINAFPFYIFVVSRPKTVISYYINTFVCVSDI